ncbi:hypothetical protein AAVH_13279 [Aphelenchoides avenae]|nr:hypothetical protein AAVH_13279 [Aphelenchus avenae]
MNHLLLTALATLLLAQYANMLFLTSRLLAAQDEPEILPGLLLAELDEICMDMPWLSSCQDGISDYRDAVEPTEVRPAPRYVHRNYRQQSVPYLKKVFMPYARLFADKR